MIGNEAESGEFEFGEGPIKFSKTIGAVGGTMNDNHGAEIPRLALGIGFRLDLLI